MDERTQNHHVYENPQNLDDVTLLQIEIVRIIASTEHSMLALVNLILNGEKHKEVVYKQPKPQGLLPSGKDRTPYIASGGKTRPPEEVLAARKRKELELALKQFLTDEIKLYKNLSKILGVAGRWILVQHFSFLTDEDKELLFLEKGDQNLHEKYGIKPVEDRTEPREVSPLQIKDRLDDFVYLCWSMFQFHSKEFTVGDVKLANFMQRILDNLPAKGTRHRGIAVIDLCETGRPTEKNTSAIGPRITYRYVPIDVKPGPSEYTNLSLDIYGMIISLYEMITGIDFSKELLNVENDQQLFKAIKADLRVGLGLGGFLFGLAGEDKKQTANFLNKLTTFFQKYLHKKTFEEIDQKVDSDSIPPELNIVDIPWEITKMLGLTIVQPENPEEPWYIKWSDDQIEAIDNIDKQN